MKNQVNSPCLARLKCLFQLNHPTTEKESSTLGQSTPTEPKKTFLDQIWQGDWPFFQVTNFCFGGECVVFQGDLKIVEDNSQKLGKS